MREIKKDTSNQSLYLVLRDTAGVEKTGLVYNSAGAVASYVRNQGLRVAITLATLAAVDSAHSDGGFKEVDSANTPGLYRLDIPDAAAATGVDNVVVYIGFTGVRFEGHDVQLVDNTAKDNYDIVNSGTFGNSAINTKIGTIPALDGAAQTVGAAIGKLADDNGGANYDATNDSLERIANTMALASVATEGRLAELDAANLPADVDLILADTGTDGVVVAAASKTGYALSAAGVQAIWDALTAALTTVGSIGKKLADWVLGSDSKTLLSTDAQSGVTIPTVTTVGTTTANSDMRGTDSAALASVCTEGRLAELDAANLPSDLDDTLADTNEMQGKLPTNNIMGSSVKTDKDDEIDTINTATIAIQAKTDNLPDGIKKNTALANFQFVMISSTDNVSPKTGLGAGVTCERSIDGAAFSACTNTASEISAGFYKITLSAADLNGDTVGLKFTASGANATMMALTTQI